MDRSIETEVVRRAWVRETLLPLVASLALHAAVVVAAMLAARAVRVVFRGTETQTAAAESDLASVELMTPVSLHGARGPGEDPFLRSTQDQDSTIPPDASGWTAVRGTNLDSLSSADGADREAEASVIGIGPDAMFPVRGTKLGDRSGGRAGPIAPFGAPVTGGTPDSGIFADKNLRAARSVAYVCDASGSMINHFSALLDQIEHSVHRLKPVQSFNIIFFQEEFAAGIDAHNLLPATAANKARAAQFLSAATASGTTDPLPALEMAMRIKPELIWLLTDGDFPNNDDVLHFIRKNNPNGRIQINTIAFVQRGDAYEKVLRTIAKENRGEFRYVDEKALR